MHLERAENEISKHFKETIIREAKLGDEIVDSNEEKDLKVALSENKMEASDSVEKREPEHSEEVLEKAAVFGFRFVNECLDEEAFEMEEAVDTALEDDELKDVEVPIEPKSGEINTNEVETLEKHRIQENTIEENVEMEENERDKEEIGEVQEKVLEVIEKKEIILENEEEDEDDELSSESLSRRWQRNKGKKFGQRNSNKGENTSSKRPRRSCQLVKGYFRK